mmetsp:Transcript_52287/g.122424  ORF Transcript_52287/g.122424 Transcript_52287/m.122424 type:complete len:239 (+) Transcript_52287:61-777(+)
MGRWSHAGHAAERSGEQQAASLHGVRNPSEGQPVRPLGSAHVWQHRFHEVHGDNHGLLRRLDSDETVVNKSTNEIKDGTNAHEEVFTTADCWNRMREKDLVEGELGLPETGIEVELFDASCPGCRVATGYTRIVYGDHGAYVELDSSQVCWGSLPVVTVKPPHAYYDEYHTEGGFVQLYKQKRSVEHKKNPPAGGIRHNREGGYADYKVGMCYISARHVTVGHLPTTPHNAHERRWKK